MGETAGTVAESADAPKAGSGDEHASRPGAAGWSVFGDPLGLAVFLGALAFAGATWQVGVFITDTYAVANGLLNVAEGHLSIERVHYSLTLGSQPGLHVVDGQLYARNYGQAVLAIPVYFALETLTAVARLELLLAAVWSFLVLATIRQAGVVLGRRRSFQVVGGLLALGLFGTSVALATPLDPEFTGLVALQVLALAATGVTALATYRLCAEVRDRRVGAVAGGATVLATPLWFWAAVPKRHALVAAAVATLLFWFAGSRRPGPRVSLPLSGSVRKDLLIRVLAYALAGLVAWVHAFEGVLLLGTLAVADLATASATSRRALVAVAIATSVGLAPFLATNLLVTGNPAEPPRLADPYNPSDDIGIGPGGRVESPDDRAGGDGSDGGSGASDDGTPQPDGTGPGDGEATGGSGAESGGDGTETGSPAEDTDGADGDATDDAEESVMDALGARLRDSSVVGYADRILAETGDAPGRLYHTYVRSGRADEFVWYAPNQQETVDLSLAESFPLVGGLVGAFLGGALIRVRSGRREERTNAPRSDGGTPDGVRGRLAAVGRSAGRFPGAVRAAAPARQTEGFALAVFAGYATLYFPVLPLHSQLTVRYLLPVFPVLVYLLARRPVVRRSVTAAGRSLAAGYFGALVVGAAAAAVAFPALDPAVGEAMQLHALVNLGVCVALVATTAGARAGIIADNRVPAAALGVAGAATTLLVVRMQLVYFEYGTYAAPVVRTVADLLGGA